MKVIKVINETVIQLHKGMKQLGNLMGNTDENTPITYSNRLFDGFILTMVS